MAEDAETSRRRHEQQQLRKQLHGQFASSASPPFLGVFATAWLPSGCAAHPVRLLPLAFCKENPHPPLEVFGPFDQFCEYVAGTTNAGSSGIMRHGVVQIPTTPLVLPARSTTMPATSSSTNSSTPQQSTQQLLHEYLNTAPSSSTHSAPDSADSSAKKGKRHRTMDSDSELERDKRKRRNEEARNSGMPGTSRSSTQPTSTSDSIRTLFGNDTERKDPPDKGISPDSGVHSAENDPGDENDVHSAQTIINLITKLSPPLSPIKQRPFDKKVERERKEMEGKERERRAKEREETERQEQQRKEKEEREQHEKEQAEREERLRNERLEQERREKEREDKNRKEREREEKERREKEREEREREDKERKEREREEKARREKEQEEKLRKEKEQEEKLRREKEREMRKQRERERQEKDKRSKESDSKDRKEKPVEKAEKTKTGDVERTRPVENEQKIEEQGSRSNGLRGEIILKSLDRSKLNQLIEIGKRTGRMKEERKDDRREMSENHSEKRKDRKEKEKKQREKPTLEELETLRRDKDSSTKSSPCMPRASSSQSHDGGDHAQVHRPASAVGNHPSRSSFECAAPECMPSKPSRPVKPEEGSTEMLYDFYHAVAKSRKRKADAETDKVTKVLLYLDTSVYFILSAKHLTSPESPEIRGNRQYTIVRDTNDLLKLEKACGHLFLDAPLEKMCAYVLTGISWLRAEYEREKLRPPPALPKRTGVS
ncbi:unnamed protein product [Heligmosomoides polygyrus]|uniref:AF4/FMR2 family member lilli n=1 Tax=Heligmosomoides polygyrus TaxID=6339 RepID=A0A3P8CGG3_HELPZ|nr:unnamed protein product [Heligmosomoides polygyrus]